jgi:hypothetical protein
VREVIDRAAAETIEIVVIALQRTEIGQPSQMPFANQRGLVTGLFQERRQGRMVRRQTKPARPTGAQRLFEPDGHPVLVTPGNQRNAGGGADCGIRIGLCEAHALGGDAIDIGRGEIAATVAGNIGIAEIVGENEQNVRQHIYLTIFWFFRVRLGRMLLDCYPTALSKRRVDLRGRIFLHSRRLVRVEIQCPGHVSMSKTFLRDPRMNPVGQQLRCMSVTKALEMNL